MRLSIFVVFALILLSFWGTSFGSGSGNIGSYALPLVETETLFTRWLQQEKFSVESRRLANGEIVVQGASAGKLIKVSFRPHSSLATEIELLELSGMEDVSAVRLSWESFLAQSELIGGTTVPVRIRSLADAVVCINSLPADEKKINFTGFLINQAGTVLTIAHDFDKLRNFRLLFSGGAIAEGRLVTSNSSKDLSVIGSDFRGYKTFLPLKEGRSRLTIEDRVFMLCRTGSGRIEIQSGVVDKPKAMVSGQKLWQVKLEHLFLGSSGSPVVDENGRLVGVVKGRYRGTESRGFLIPVDTVRSFVGMGNK